ncbi:MAG: hypothetical protein LBL31_05080, partial [Spirochaetaceae bacterium]|nr:hypothetical protein [Spirochaetaceae bacterium]
EVTFKNVTINGLYDPEVDEDSKAENRGLLVTGAGTSVTLDTGTTVTGKITGSNGGGVLVESGATLTMKGGSKVTGSRTTGNGGGVAVSLATFNMEGGEISGNEANRGGGVYLSGEQVGTVFSMTGSSIIYGSTNGTLVKRNIGIAEHNKGAALYRGLESAASKGTDDLTEICYEEDLTVVN